MGERGEAQMAVGGGSEGGRGRGRRGIGERKRQHQAQTFTGDSTMRPNLAKEGISRALARSIR